MGCCKLFTLAWIGLGSLRFGCTQHIFPALCYYWAYWAGLDWMGLYRADLWTCFCLVFLPLLSLCLRFCLTLQKREYIDSVKVDYRARGSSGLTSQVSGRAQFFI